MRQRKGTVLCILTATVALICASCSPAAKSPASAPANAPAAEAPVEKVVEPTAEASPTVEPTEPAAAPAPPPPGNALLLTLTGHTAAVDGLAVTQDGQLIASSSGGDGSVRVWDSAGSLMHTFAGLPPGSSRLALSPDGSLLAVGMAETVWLWRLPDGQQLQRLSVGIGQPVTGVAFSQDGRALVTTWGDGWVRLWRVPEGDLADSFDAGAVGRSTAVSSDGTMAAVGAAGGMALVWSLADKSRLSVLQGQTGAILSLAFSPDGQFLAAGEDDGDVRVWQPASGALLATLTGHTDAVNGISFTADGEKLVTASTDGTVRIWRMADGAQVGSVPVGQEITSLAVTDGGRRLITGGLGMIWVWEWR